MEWMREWVKMVGLFFFFVEMALMILLLRTSISSRQRRADYVAL